MTSQQKDKLLKAKVAVALQHATGKVPTTEPGRAGGFACPRALPQRAGDPLQTP